MSDRHISGPQLARLLRIDAGERPYYRALARALRELILDGGLAVRVRLPAERHLAQALGVSRTTVTAAYDRLRGQGYLDSRRGSGSWTALPDPVMLAADDPWVASRDDGMLQMHIAAPPAAAQLPAALEEAARDLPRHMLGIGYEPLGLPELREAVAARYTARGLATRPEQILITSGAQHAIHLVMSLLLRHGMPVLAESPAYPHALETVRRLGGRTSVVGITDNGWDLDLLCGAMEQTGARVAYLMPDFHNPTGRLMDDATRAGLVAAARRHETTLVVDECWAELAIDPLPPATPMAAFDTDSRVISIGSASKLWWGGLRVGWIRASAATVRRLAALRASVDVSTPLLEQLVVARLFPRIEETRAERRRTLRDSRDTLVSALRDREPSWTFTVPAGGGSLWVRLSAPHATALADAAACHGLRLAPGPWFGPDGALERWLRLPFTHPPQVIIAALDRLARARAVGPYGSHSAAPLTPAL